VNGVCFLCACFCWCARWRRPRGPLVKSFVLHPTMPPPDPDPDLGATARTDAPADEGPQLGTLSAFNFIDRRQRRAVWEDTFTLGGGTNRSSHTTYSSTASQQASLTS
jgi:hypothetical protein